MHHKSLPNSPFSGILVQPTWPLPKDETSQKGEEGQTETLDEIMNSFP